MSHYFPESYMWSHAMLLALGTIPWGGGEIGEIDPVGQRLKNRVGENDAWYEEWHRMAGRVESLAVQAAQAGHGVTARETFLRACNYYHLAERFLPPQDERKLTTYQKARLCFTQAAAHLTPPVEHVEILYEGTALPAYFVAALRLPPTVQGVLAARIDRLTTEEKALLQQLAVIGREFPLSLARQIVSQPEEELYRLLSSLQGKEFVYEQPAFPEVEYSFKHALTQEVAYNSVLIERRKTLHEQAAQAIEQLYHDQLEDHFSDLARHYTRSGNTPKAIEYLQLAGQQAVQRSANTEAITHLTSALDLLKTLPDTPKHAQQELTLQLTLAAALQATKSYIAPEVESAYMRARALCRQVGETPQLFAALIGLRRFYYVQGKLQTAHELEEELLRLAQSAQDIILLALAHHVSGATSFVLGELLSAREHFEQGMTAYDPQQYRALAFLFGDDPEVVSLSYAALALWSLGYPDQALKRSQEALTLAQKLSHPFSLAFALSFAAMLHQYRREGQVVQERAEATITLSTEQESPFWLTLGTILQGWALVEQGQGKEGITQMREGLVAFRATGTELRWPYYLALLAGAYGTVGQAEEGLGVLTEALATMDRTGERFYEAELYRLKGELTLQEARQKSKGKSQKSEIPDPKSQILEPQLEAEACFHKAIEIARKQQAKSLELRAVISLARLWRQQGKQDEGYKLLAEIYNWFTEGFDTKDLQEAKTLLEELSH